MTPPAPTKTQGAFQNHEQQRDSIKSARFTGTDNPRHLRAIAALLRRPMPRESLDKEAGASNGPELVAELRHRGLEVPCKRIGFLDRHGYPCRPGVYSLTAADCRKFYALQSAQKVNGSDGKRS